MDMAGAQADAAAVEFAFADIDIMKIVAARASQVAIGVEEEEPVPHVSASNDNNEADDSRQQAASNRHRQNQLPRQGAHVAAPGSGLQRIGALQFSSLLLSASTPTTLPSLSIHQDNFNSNGHPQQESLVEATPVSEHPEDDVVRPSANPVDLQQLERSRQKTRRQKHRFVAFRICLCTFGAIVVGSALASQPNSQAVAIVTACRPSIAPSGVPSSAPSSSCLDLLLMEPPQDTLSSIFNTAGNTPHWKAWNWLSSHQNLTNLVKWRKKQLFAMAAFFFAFGGEH